MVPINAKLHPKEAAWIFQDAGVQLAFVESKLEKAFLAELKKGFPVKIIPVNDNGIMTVSTFLEASPVSLRQPEDLAWLFST